MNQKTTMTQTTMSSPPRFVFRIVGLCGFVLLTLQSIALPQEMPARVDSIAVSGTTMGPIVYNITVARPPNGLTETQVKKSVQATLNRINDLMSTYKSDSDITRFSQSKSTEWISVATETATVVARAIEISKLTDGAFDVTVAPAVNAWRFGPNKSQAFEIPNQQEIASLKQVVGFQKLAVRIDPPAIKKSIPGVSIDLSAIAKGYAVDQVGVTLRELGCTNYMVEVGGEVCVHGQSGRGGPWRIGVEKPEAMSLTSIGTVAKLTDQAMATSGDYRNFEEVAGRRYSHTIDPSTCVPVEHSLATACVVAPDCMTADALATAVMVMGSPRGRERCEQLGLELLTFARDSDFGDKLTVAHTSGFPFAEADPTKSKSGTNEPKNVVSNDQSDNLAAVNSIWPAFIGAVTVISLAILGMAIGSIFGNKPVQGSCGGLANMTNKTGDSNCSICAKPTSDCVEPKA